MRFLKPDDIRQTTASDVGFSKSGGSGGRETLLSHLPGFRRSLRVLEGLTESTVHAYTRKILEFSTWLSVGDITSRPADITRRHIEDYLEWCFNQGNTNITRTTKQTALSKYFRYLKYEGIIPADVTADMPRPRITKKLMLTFTRSEVLRLFTCCDITAEKGLRDACVLVLAVFCGLRISEITALNLNDIIDDSSDIDINVTGKKGHNRRVWLWRAPGRLIRQYLLTRITLHRARGSDPFLVSYCHSRPKGRRLTSGALDRLIKKHAARAGLRKAEIHAHMFRATHANDLQSVRGYTLPAIMERMGWLDLSTAGRYLVRRERVHREYRNLHEYWIDFTRVWSSKEEPHDSDAPRDAADSGGPALAP